MKTVRFDSANYEFNKSSKIGIYMIHGFSSTTYEVLKLAKYLKNKNYHVVANNLPGHGTSIEDCNRVKYTDWLEFSKMHIAKLASQCDKIYIVGCSMGALVSLYLASMFPVNGVIIGGVVVKFHKSFLINYINPFLCKLLKKSKKEANYSNEVLQKIYFYGYEYYPLVALNEFRKMIKHMENKYENIKCPMLIFHSTNDEVSSEENFNYVNSKINTKIKETVILNQAHHNIFDTNPEIDLIYNKIEQFIKTN